MSLAVIVVALGYRWPAVHAGFTVDDYAQLAMMKGDYPVPRAGLSLFTFSDGSLAENRRLRAVGFFPWWSDPQLRVSFFRPLASALMWVDLRAFGDDAFAYHLHTVAWWVCMMLAWAAVLRRVLPFEWALLSLAVCAFHPAHATVLGWIADRNAAVSSAFALVALYCLLRAQQDGTGSGRSAALVSFGLALCGSEYALGFAGYLLAYEVLRSPSVREARRALWPWVVLIGAYSLGRALLGFGTRESGMYIDPSSEPLAFVRAALSRVPVLIGDLVFAVRSTWWSSGFPWAGELARRGVIPARWATDLSGLRALQVGIGCVALLVAWAVSRVAWRATASRALRFAVVGWPLAVLPASASLPESRLLLPALFGWTIVLAQFGMAAVAAVRERGARTLGRRSVVGVAAGLFALELALPQCYSSGEARLLASLSNAIRASMLLPEVDQRLRHTQRALLLSAVDPTTTIYVPLLRRFHGHVGPATCQLLLSAYSQLELTRVGERSFVLRRLQSDFTPTDVYARAFNRHPLHAGDRFVSPGLQVRVERVLDGRPMRVRYTLDRSLDAPDVTLLAQTALGLRPVAFPPAGGSAVLPPPVVPLALMNAP